MSSDTTGQTETCESAIRFLDQGVVDQPGFAQARRKQEKTCAEQAHHRFEGFGVHQLRIIDGNAGFGSDHRMGERDQP